MPCNSSWGLGLTSISERVVSKRCLKVLNKSQGVPYWDPQVLGRRRVVLVQSLWCLVLVGFPEQWMWYYFTNEEEEVEGSWDEWMLRSRLLEICGWDLDKLTSACGWDLTDVRVGSDAGHRGNMSTNLCRSIVVVWQHEARPSAMMGCRC